MSRWATFGVGAGSAAGGSPRRRWSLCGRFIAVQVVAVVAVASALTLGLVEPADAAPAAGTVSDPVSYVNPLIGTQDEGNTYPGPTVPFGMVQLSPDTGHSTGYDYGQTGVRGFSLVHLSGVGCGLGGMLPVLPTTGDIGSTDYGSYYLPLDHSSEQAQAGYYKVGLQASAGPITAELTATMHTGVQRYTFPSTTEANVMIDAGQALSSVQKSSVTVVDDQTVDAAITVAGFCEPTQPFTVYTRTHFSRPFTSFGTWTGNAVSAGSSTASSTDRTGAYVRFDTTSDNVVEAQTSLSYVDPAGAAANLAAEATTFDAAHSAATTVWNDQLSKIAVSSSDTDQLTTFYSALYRSFLAPNTGTDVDGRYMGWDQKTHIASGYTYYQDFSLWDTYRTQQQFLALIEPRRSADMAYSLVLEAEQGGWAPRWSYGPVETNIMTGDPITPFLVSAWSEGLLKGHEAEAYAVLKRNADDVPPADSPTTGRTGNPVFNADGYVPYDTGAKGKPGTNDMQNGGSATLEYAVSDAMLSTMAKALGHNADAERYAAAGENYRAIFDSTTGAFRARHSDGLFDQQTDPANAPGFHEGTAVQYEWLVPQDMPGLMGLLGGRSATAKRLDSFFAYDQLSTDPAGTARNVWVNGAYSYYNQDKYNPNNEPDLGSPYAYLWAGQPWKTTDVVRAALTLFTDGPTGVTGNDDLGEMSSWAVMSSIGLYPIIPGSDVWGLSTPVFSSVDVTLDPDYYPSGSLHITAPGVSGTSHYEQSVSVGGKDIDRAYLSGAELGKAGTIAYTVGSKPSDWATAAADAPPAVVSDDGSTHRLTVGASTPSVVVAAGAQGTLTVSALAQGEGTITGTLEVKGSAAVSVTGGGSWTVAANGGSAQTAIPVSLQVAAGTAAGDYPVHLTVDDDAGDSATADVTVVVPQQNWLQPGFDNVGIGDEGKANADFDGMGYYFLRDQLASVGIVQGESLTVPGTDLSYILGPVPAGQPDNLLASGQTTDVSAALGSATEIALVGAGNNGDHGGQLLLKYADGSTQTVTATLSDWCTPDASTGDISLPAPGVRGDHTGTQNIGCGLYSTQPITLTGKGLSSITWPDDQKMHVFAVASDAAPTAPKAPSLGIGGTAAVGETVTAGSPDWNVAGTTTTYQWSVDGANIASATSSHYTITPEDLGKTLAVVATGTAPGYVPGTIMSAGTKVEKGTFVATARPSLSGTAKVGETLTVTAGAYSVDGIQLAYAWEADGTPIDGAHESTLTLAAAQIGEKITAVVTATKAGYATVTSASAPTDAVRADTHSGYVPKLKLTASDARRGDAVSVIGAGFAPHEKVTISLHSAPVELDVVTADGDGAFSSKVVIPNDATVGNHEIQAVGDVSQVVASASITVDPAGGAALATTGLPENAELLALLCLLALAGGAALLVVRSALRRGGRS
ncbi:glycoside hydrolase family 92 protein [Humibacter ginsenosidimutans]|uniref:Glycoside hydrolase family 92 protein n=1 Tax=Humibacter ginsenosidimutans TaxID=2599293 RepID=A0A5B8M7R3_9MICO|nr:glycoside hydrolase family 92 protein [Humibacter ginsenosidimutans]